MTEDTRERILRALDTHPYEKLKLFTTLKLLGDRWNHADYVMRCLRQEGLVVFNRSERWWQRTKKRTP